MARRMLQILSSFTAVGLFVLACSSEDDGTKGTPTADDAATSNDTSTLDASSSDGTHADVLEGDAHDGSSPEVSLVDAVADAPLDASDASSEADAPLVCDTPANVITQSSFDDHSNGTTWQSFTVPSLGKLTKVSVRVNTYDAGGAASTGFFNVYVGEGNAGTRIHQQAFSFASQGGLHYEDFVVTADVLLLASTTYTWEVAGVKSVSYDNGNPYANGRTSVVGWDTTFALELAACQ